MLSSILKFVSYFAVFYSVWVSSDLINLGNYKEAINTYLLYGLIPLSLISAFRHMILTGSILKGQSFFEFEAGGANLGVGLTSIWSLYNKFDTKANGLIILIYTIYLLSSLISWIIYNKNNSIFKVISFLSIILVNSYFVYIAFNH